MYACSSGLINMIKNRHQA